MTQISKREKMLLALVGGVVLLLVSVGLISHFFKQAANIRSEIATKRSSWKSQQALLADRDLWQRRDAWLKANQPKLRNADNAGVQLFDEIKQIAQTNSVKVLSPSINSLTKTPYYQSISVDVQTLSSWESLMQFLYQLQQPGKFIALEAVKIEVKSNDPTQMQCKFKIARWFAP